MRNKLKTILRKYWVAFLALVVFAPLLAIASTGGGVIDISTLPNKAIAIFQNSIYTVLGYGSTIVVTDTYDSYVHLLPAGSQAGWNSFLNSTIGQFLVGTCTCQGKSCGQKSSCGTTCVSQTCGSGKTCDRNGFCVSQCTPNCKGKTCGSDGCGGVCGGVCGSDDYCNNGNCLPCSCNGPGGNFLCGTDQCGRSCGSCGGQEKCLGAWASYNLSYNCVACTPNCPDGYCGSDGCGGYCSCSAGQACSSSDDYTSGTCGACTPNCDGKICGDDGCGGSCGSCNGGDMCGSLSGSGGFWNTFSDLYAVFANHGTVGLSADGPSEDYCTGCSFYDFKGFFDHWANGYSSYYETYGLTFGCSSCATDEPADFTRTTYSGCSDCRPINVNDTIKVGCTLCADIPTHDASEDYGFCTSCQPTACDGSYCGPDGCGGTCECGEGQVCSSNSVALSMLDIVNGTGFWTGGVSFSSPSLKTGQCVSCTPDCHGKPSCADDGCGGVCGETCDPGQFCDQNLGCLTCSCEGSTCGTDGCGNSCGNCDPNAEICTAPAWDGFSSSYLQYNCQPCPDEHLGCGFSACGRYYGSCASGQTCVNNQCN